MKKKRYTEEQIIGAIKQHESGIKVEDICRRLSISNGTFYNWRSISPIALRSNLQHFADRLRPRRRLDAGR